MSTETITLIVAIVVAVVALTLAFIYLGKKKEVIHIVAQLVQEAELMWADPGYGEVKYAWVVGKVYPLLPAVVRMFISEKTIGTMIERAVNELQEMLVRAEAKCADKIAGAINAMVGGGLDADIDSADGD